MKSRDERDLPRLVVLRRVRNRIIDYLTLASSIDAQRKYQARTPVSVPHEVINQWEDWVPDPASPDWASPIFSPEETAAISRFHAVWQEVVRSTPDPLPRIEETVALPAWRMLREAAELALGAFMLRGRSAEDDPS